MPHDERPDWIVTASERLPNGHLEVTYSLASGVRYVAQVDPSTDAAAAIRKTGDTLAAIYAVQGYV